MLGRRSLVLVFVGLALSAAACSSTTDGGSDANDSEVVAGPLTVLSAVTRSCSTSSVRGLSLQLVEEINCAHPDAIASLENIQGLALGNETFPFGQAPLVDALKKAAAGSKTAIRITSLIRTLPQQYLVHEWAGAGRCQIPMAASPGSSNHEQGLAVDVENGDAVGALLTKAGSCPAPKAPKRACFSWLGDQDPVHYDYRGDGALDLSGESVRAFQRLWNRNHPEDVIAVSGTFDAKTEARLKKTPAGGFPVGADCKPPPSSQPTEPEAPAADTSQTDPASP
jgi:hypothetical protein